MRRFGILGAGLALAMLGAAVQARAQSSEQAVPPPNSMKLSQLIARVEQRDQFHYVGEVEWNTSGYYDVIYYTKDKAKVEIKFDPVSGQPK